MSERRRFVRRDDERLELELSWQANCKRRKAGWPPTLEHLSLGQHFAYSTSHTFDAQGNPVTVTLHGERAWIAARKTDQHFAQLHDKVERWNKEISGKDVMEILELALMLTNNPAYEAARKAMILHRLDTGGLRRAFRKLQRRHNEPPERTCADCISWYMDQFGYGLRRAVEHVVADLGIPGSSFSGAVEKVRKAYGEREQQEAERQRYLNELHGLRDLDETR